ncbi:RNA polymerase sigma factor [Neolewinella agarilytica]|uniref:RNA polymerase sigma-70 factor, ECF subfamily n=1 Tax=Neolewinella agarilytica TaxID=478744 RepID=A0A1H9KXI6_9BACT|nr:RNA polymerase sigma factor [Neolewinella agarilytica]SER03882.1 RNA polymerase sigma-70 factor, ECF subfamily [Neolewinella agarilytica]
MTIEQINSLNQTHLPEFKTLALSLTRDGDRARDLLQEVNYQIFKNRNSFQYGTDFSAWVKRIIRNVFISDYRRTKRRREILAQYGLPTGFSSDLTVTNKGTDLLEAEEVTMLIEQLPCIYREVFLMHFQGLTYEEIAQRSQVPLGTVKSRLFKARSILKKKLNGRGLRA